MPQAAPSPAPAGTPQLRSKHCLEAALEHLRSARAELREARQENSGEPPSRAIAHVLELLAGPVEHLQVLLGREPQL